MTTAETPRIVGKFVPPTADTIEREKKRQWEIVFEIRKRLLTAKAIRAVGRGEFESDADAH